MDSDWAGALTFTNCGQTGHTGPSQSQCDGAYAGTTLEGLVTLGNGIQAWTVSDTGTYSIEVAGAKGGDHDDSSAQGGAGAMMSGEFNLIAGETLYLIVGQRGRNGQDSGARSGGGGGGSFVYTGSSNTNPTNLLIAAGGGGGAPHTGTGTGEDGVTQTSGTANNNGTASGGNNGSGGGSVTTNGYDGGAGAGWNADGAGVTHTTGGKTFYWGGWLLFRLYYWLLGRLRRRWWCQSWCWWRRRLLWWCRWSKRWR